MAKKYTAIPFLDKERLNIDDKKEFEKIKTKYFADTNVLELATAGHFFVTVQEYDEEIVKIENEASRLDLDANRSINKSQKPQILQQAKAKRAEKQKIFENYSNVGWSFQTRQNYRADLIENNGQIRGLVSFQKNINQIYIYKKIQFPKLFEGGGLIWIETFDASSNKPQGNGFFVRATGKPKIHRTVWTTMDNTPLMGDVAPMSSVLLHIYTEALYGEELEIFITSSDSKNPDEIPSAEIFQTAIGEVRSHEPKPFDKNGGNGVSGRVITEKYDATKKDTASFEENRLQKTVIEVRTSIGWCKEEKTPLYVAIRLNKDYTVFEEFDNPPLQLHRYKSPDFQKPDNNTFAYIDNNEVEVDPITFQHCRMNQIILTGDSKKEVLFDTTNNIDRKNVIVNANIIAGEKKTYTLNFAFDTNECHKGHHGKELSIIQADTIFTLNGKPIVMNKRTEPDSKFVTTQFGTGFSIGTVSTGLELKNGETSKTTQNETLNILLDTNKVEFEAQYPYNFPENVPQLDLFKAVLNYFWLSSSNSDLIKTFTVQAVSCAYQRNTIVNIYPDIKWTIKLGFNMTSEMIDSLNSRAIGSKLKHFEDTQNEKEDAKQKAWMDNNPDRKAKIEERKNKLIQKHGLKEKTKEPEVIDKGKKLSTLMDILGKISFSLEEEHYNGTKTNNLTNHIVKEVWEDFKTVRELIKNGLKIIEGDHDKKETDEEQERSIERLTQKLNRKAVEYEILYPKFGLAGSWQYETGKAEGQRLPQVGLGANINLKAAPLIGVSIKWDLLELLCRKHPLAYAVLKAVDGAIDMLFDDESAINLDFTVTGQIDTSINFAYNSVEGFKSLNAKGKESIEFDIKLELSIKKTIKKASFEAIGKLGFSTGSTTGMGVEQVFGIDNKGFYFQNDLIFEGLKFYFAVEAEAEFVVKKRKKDKTIFKSDFKVDGEITMLNHTFSSDKVYLKR